VKPLLLAAYLAAFAGDAATSDIALRRGAREVVLPTQNRAVVAGVFAGEAVAGYYAYRWLRPDHPRMARVVYVAVVASHSMAAAWNARQLARGAR
jgi:hypothetical protein